MYSGTYYWYMYLLDINELPLPGRKAKGIDATPETRSFSKEDDIEATAGSSS